MNELHEVGRRRGDFRMKADVVKAKILLGKKKETSKEK
jgi:hypothetical protein